jgi:hypothetical protein
MRRSVAIVVESPERPVRRPTVIVSRRSSDEKLGGAVLGKSHFVALCGPLFDLVSAERSAPHLTNGRVASRDGSTACKKTTMSATCELIVPAKCGAKVEGVRAIVPVSNLSEAARQELVLFAGLLRSVAEWKRTMIGFQPSSSRTIVLPILVGVKERFKTTHARGRCCCWRGSKKSARILNLLLKHCFRA